MKKLTIVVILVAATLLLLPPVLGMQAHTRLEESLARAAEQSGPYADILLEDYERGWFSSTGKIRLRFTDAYVADNPILATPNQDGESIGSWLTTGFAQDIDIAHGPIFVGQQAGFGFGEVVTTLDGSSTPELAAILEQTGNDYFLRSSMLIGFTGMSEVAVDAPAFTLEQPDDDLDSIVFAGAYATGDIDFVDMRLVVDGQLNGFSVTGRDGEAVIERTTFAADVAYPESDPYGLGSGEMTVTRVVAVTKDQTALDIRQAKIAFDSSKNDAGKVSASLTYLLEQLTTAGVALADMEAKFTMDEMDAAALTRLQELTNAFTPNPTEPTEALGALMDPAYDLLAGGAGLSFDPVRFTYNDLSFAAAVNVRSKPANLPPRAAFSFDNPLILLNLFTVDAELAIDRELALELAVPQLKQQLAAGVPDGAEVDDAQLEEMARAQAPMMIGALVGQGVLREENGKYMLNAQYDNGALLVNGNPLPLGAMLGQGT